MADSTKADSTKAEAGEFEEERLAHALISRGLITREEFLPVRGGDGATVTLEAFLKGLIKAGPALRPRELFLCRVSHPSSFQGVLHFKESCPRWRSAWHCLCKTAQVFEEE